MMITKYIGHLSVQWNPNSKKISFNIPGRLFPFVSTSTFENQEQADKFIETYSVALKKVKTVAQLAKVVS